MSIRRWLVLSVTAPSTESIPSLAERLLALGGSAVREEGLVLTSYVPPPENVEEFLEQVRDELRVAAEGAVPEIAWCFEPDRDWAVRWKRGLRPRRVGRRVIVAPTWAEPRPRPGDIVIRIDPQMAFGTGEHATTRGVLRLLQEIPLDGAPVLDIGTGSGILSIAAVKLGAERALGIDRDEFALENARSNIIRNDVEDRVELRHDVVDDAFLRGRHRLPDVVLANTLSSIVEPLFPALSSSLGEGGILIVGGILVEEKPRVVDAGRRAGFRLDREDVEDEWWSAVLRPAPAAEPSKEREMEGNVPAG